MTFCIKFEDHRWNEQNVLCEGLDMWHETRWSVWVTTEKKKEYKKCTVHSLVSVPFITNYTL